jgi:hypothetical protein
LTDKQVIINDIRKNYGNMLNLRELTEALGYKDKRAALKFMEGVPHCDMGKEKKFLAIDIANRIHSRMEAS